MNADEREPEVQFRERLVVHPPCHKRIPEVGCCEDRERNHAGDDEMEMPNHVVRAVKEQVNRDGREKDAGHAANNERRDPSDTEKHRHRQPDVAVPHRRDPVKHFNRTRHADGDHHGHERPTDTWIDPGREHVMRPDAEREHTDRQRRVDDELEAKELWSRELRDDVAEDAERWQHDEIHFGVAPEPKEVLIEDRPAVFDREEGRTDVPIKQEHDEHRTQ